MHIDNRARTDSTASILRQMQLRTMDHLLQDADWLPICSILGMELNLSVLEPRQLNVVRVSFTQVDYAWRAS